MSLAYPRGQPLRDRLNAASRFSKAADQHGEQNEVVVAAWRPGLKGHDWGKRAAASLVDAGEVSQSGITHLGY